MTAVPAPQTDTNTGFAQRSELLLLVAMLAVIVVLLVPLPTVVLDMLLALNLAMSILLLLITLSARQPLDVSVFPSMLLLMTLYRLAVNVATTRLILSSGDAGKIVSTFGGIIVGNSLIVGVVIFLILVIIQFIVITKGASRISEVNARFVLDAMPGKQMAIDAEAGSGAISKDEAQERRRHLAREAEFFGAMDGASKYVRGDAIAGLIITGVNIVGGVLIGMTEGLSINEALQLYSILTIGDGVVSQVPALIIATTAGVLVTKASSDQSLGHEVGAQMLANRRPLLVGSILLFIVAWTPGLPKLPFLVLAGLSYFVAQRMQKAAASASEAVKKTSEAEQAQPASAEERENATLSEFLTTDRVRIEVGLSLVPLVETGRNTGLEERISNMRKDVGRQFGYWIPAVRIREDLRMPTHEYRVLINGRVVGQGMLRPNDYLIMDRGQATLEVDGEDVREPVFGLPAKWIDSTNKQRAEIGGYTVVDAPSVLITHLQELFRRHAHELLNTEDLQNMLKQVEQSSPALINELKPEIIRTGTLRRVLAHLLAEQVSISALEPILESVAHHGQHVKHPEMLCDLVRQDIGYVICQRYLDAEGLVKVIVMEPRLENEIKARIQEGKLQLDSVAFENLVNRLQPEWDKFTARAEHAALLVDESLRRPLRTAIQRSLPEMAVLAYTEIPLELQIAPTVFLKPSDVFRDPPPETMRSAS